MLENPFHRAIYVTGPTAVGKTSVAVALARRIGAEVVAMDASTLYRGMNIGTAKPTHAEQGGVTHHLIDVLDPWEAASVADYRGWALQSVNEVEGRGKRALFVGGTALYLKTLLRGLFDGPSADPVLRSALEREAEQLGNDALHARLAIADPSAAARLHPNDRRRVIRALEVIEVTGHPISLLQAEHHRPAPPEVQVWALERPRAELSERIDRRVVQMFVDGLVNEVRALHDAERPPSAVAAQAVGYAEVREYLRGRAGLEATRMQIQVRTRQFAKRQATWFRGLAEVRPFPIGPGEPAQAVAERLAGRIECGPDREPRRLALDSCDQ